MLIVNKFNSTINKNNKMKLMQAWPQCKTLELNQCNQKTTNIKQL